MKPRQQHLLSGFVRFFCVLSLILVAFAHRPAFAYDPDAAAASFVFPDGSVAVNCLGGSGKNGRHDASKHCEFCRIAGSAAMPALSGDFEYCAMPDRAWLPTPGREAFVRPALVLAAAPRGPPSRQS